MRNISTPHAYQGPSRSADPYVGGVITKHGWFSDEDLRCVHHRWISDRNGHRLLQFPYSVTVMGEPMYRAIPDYVIREREQREEQDRAAG